ncbi:MAG: S-methyl-5-thioribose-1-phosphate isomerase [Thermoplasmata archaeon]|nr:S-methyl-5-thioribose-1-phosphate isomerase [Thermoplasmata archaeon]
MKVNITGNIEDIRAVWMEGKTVQMLEQRLLPHRLEIFTARTVDEVCYSISDMVVRGAPAIGVTAAYGMALAILTGEDKEASAAKLKATRPTAYDLFHAVDHMIEKLSSGVDAVSAAEEYADAIVEKCRLIGEYGEPLIPDGGTVLTHCNAGALATVDYGTALAPIRAAHNKGKKIFVYADETRPRLQGAALTSWELVQEGIDHAIIVDNAAGHYMFRKEIDLCIVGADRITASGDFANKIGTYEKAVVAKENDIPFYVAAPVSTFDFSLASGSDIPIEERSQDEVRIVNDKLICHEDAKARNPAFDVTPARFVKGFITEIGVLAPDELERLKGC